MSFDRARAVADAVLFEGYVLYPYRATAPKNQFRWSFGVLAPRDWSEAGGCEPWWMATQCLVEGDVGARIEGQLRFLRVVRRTVEVLVDGIHREVDRAEVGDRLLLAWEEGEVHELPFDVALGDAVEQPISLAPVTEVEQVEDARVVRRRESLEGRIVAVTEPVGARLFRLTVRVENLTVADIEAARQVALRSAAIGAHVILATSDAAFCSLLDPPEHAREAAAACVQHRAWPVLAGPQGARDLVLASPIILYDHPSIAPESHGDFFDATEIDELLTLRTATLTPEEKRVARATDPRAAAVLDRVDHLPPEQLARLHGAIRDLADAEMVPRREPDHDPAAAADVGVDIGAKVRLRPGARRTDAQDLLYIGQLATVRAVRRDVDGSPHVAVTIDADPAAALHQWYGRFHWYRADEVEVLPAGEPT